MPPKISSAAPDVGQRLHVEGVHPVDRRQEVERQEADDHQRRAEQRVEEELDRGVLALLSTPDPDDEVHREQGDLEEDEEQDEVLGEERADHPRLEDQDQDEERLGVLGLGEVVPRVDDAERHDQHRQGDHRQREPVERQVVVAVDERDPGLVDHELELAGPVVVEVDEQQHADHADGQAGDQGDDLVQLLLGLRDHEHDRHADQRQERGEREPPAVEKRFHRMSHAPSGRR